MSDISRFLSVFHRPHVGVIQAARQLLADEQAPLRQKLLADLLHTVSENIAAETRAEDPPWFEGAWDSGPGELGLGGFPRAGHLGRGRVLLQFPKLGAPQARAPQTRGLQLSCSRGWSRTVVGTYDTQLTILTVVKGTAQGHYIHPHCCAALTISSSRTSHTAPLSPLNTAIRSPAPGTAPSSQSLWTCRSRDRTDVESDFLPL